jgi:hypothetical protein
MGARPARGLAGRPCSLKISAEVRIGALPAARPQHAPYALVEHTHIPQRVTSTGYFGVEPARGAEHGGQAPRTGTLSFPPTHAVSVTTVTRQPCTGRASRTVGARVSAAPAAPSASLAVRVEGSPARSSVRDLWLPPRPSHPLPPSPVWASQPLRRLTPQTVARVHVRCTGSLVIDVGPAHRLADLPEWGKPLGGHPGRPARYRTKLRLGKPWRQLEPADRRHRERAGVQPPSVRPRAVPTRMAAAGSGRMPRSSAGAICGTPHRHAAGHYRA